jgi:membrane protease YdiL (CAAX protease family)
MLGGTTRDAPRAATARRDERARATASAWWAWRWRGWAGWHLDTTVVVLAAVTVAVDVITAWTGTTLGTLGRVPMSPALPLAVLLGARLGAAALGCTRASLRAWGEVTVGLGAVLLASVVAYSLDAGGPSEAGGLVVAAAGEELVYRLAVLIVAGALAARIIGRDWRNVEAWGSGPGLAALLCGAAVFSLLPGHVSQVQGPASALPFASLALVLGWVVLRTGALAPVVAAHAVLNLATITLIADAMPGGLRLGLAGATLVAVVVGADVAGRRMHRLRPVPSVIDLTAV